MAVRPAVTAQAPPLALALALLACGHTGPFDAPPPPADSPLVPGLPARLTYNPLPDVAPRWAQDGSGIFYTFSNGPRAGGDRCLGVLPPRGGTRREICDRRFATAGTIETFSSAESTADGRLAYMFSQAFRGSPVAVRAEIRLARLEAPLDFRIAHTFPSRIAGLLVDAASHLAWVDEGTLLFLAERVTYIDTMAFASGVAAATLDLAGGAARLIDGTVGAASVALAPTGSDILFTLPGDGRIFEVPLAGGTPTVRYDVGPVGLELDIAVAGTRLVAAVDGALRIIDLNTGAEHLVPGSAVPGSVFLHPSLAPDGRVTAQGLVPAVSPGYDIYLFEAP